MDDPVLEVDYLVRGAGAAGMAFTDALVAECDATVAIVDRNHRPGGHWNHAYPYVRLHQPSAFYGVNSRKLGSGARDSAGLNAGYHELASGAEVVSYFEQHMRQSLLPTGRVSFFPMSELAGDGTVTSLLTGRQRKIRARKVVDATWSQTRVPSQQPPAYRVAPGVACIAPNALPGVGRPWNRYVVIGAGKTGMDACLWLLENGVDPDRIHWVLPRDYWWIDRGTYQPGDDFLPRLLESIANGVEAIARGESVADVFARLEAFGEVRRLDPAVQPTGYHGGFVSQAELAQLRRIRDVVRLGRVSAIEPDRIVLRDGTLPAGPDWLHIDCSAAGIPPRPAKPIFEEGAITLQWVRLAQPTFSWALLGHVEATRRDDAEKNAICTPIAPPDVPGDWLRMMATELANQYRWSRLPDLRAWQRDSRLDPFTGPIGRMGQGDGAAAAHLERYVRFVGAAARKIPGLLDQVAPSAAHSSSSKVSMS
jgi:hypothetical protein